MEYLFENKEKKAFKDCNEKETKLIVDGLVDNRCDRFVNNGLWCALGGKPRRLTLYGIYRVREPKPVAHTVDWSQLPKEFRYCFSSPYLKDPTATTHLPEVETQSWGELILRPSKSGTSRAMRNGELGFKRGNVSSLDSLLVRPI